MKQKNRKIKQVPTDETVVEVKDLAVRIESQEIIEKISFTLKRNSISMMIGPNGSGKTTLIRAVMGLIPLEDGSVRLFGKKPAQFRERIGYVPQRFYVDDDFPITVEEFLSLTAEVKGGRGMARALKEVGMERTEQKQLSQLSGGQLQRVLIARALLGKPLLLVLDEPVSSIDVVGSKSIYEHLDFIRRRYDVTIIIISHEMDLVSRYADQVLCINKHLMCSGAPKEVFESKEMQKIYGSELTHYHHH